MQLSDYASVLRRRWWVILLVMIIAAGSAYIFSKLQTPVFRSEAEYGLTPSRLDNGLTIVLQNSMNRFQGAALAPIQLEKISSDLKLDRSADWMLEHVTIQPRPDDWKMVVQVDYPNDPVMAQRLADAVGTNMVAIVSQLNALASDSSDRIFMSVQQPARTAWLFRPQTRINVLAGLVLGAILGVLLAFLLEALDNTLKGSGDVERYVGLTVLGAIPALDHERGARDKGRAPTGWRGILRRQT